MRKRAWLAIAITATAGACAFHFSLSSAEAQSARGALAHGLAAPGQQLSGPVVDALRRERAEASAREQERDRLDAQLRPMPDLTQTYLGLPGGGDAWCGPVAVSNALAWLSSQGRETLIPGGNSPRAQQIDLIRKIGSARYMGTTPNGGTGTNNLLRGLHAFMRDSGWGYRRLQYQGWRGHPARFTTRVKSAEVAFIAQALSEGGIAVIHAGWYTPAKWGGDFFRRHGGHWLTVVGANVDETGHAAEDTLVVHDPAPYAGAEGARHFVKLSTLQTGWLLAEDGAFPAKGYRSLGGGMKIKKDGDIAVLDGAVVLVP